MPDTPKDARDMSRAEFRQARERLIHDAARAQREEEDRRAMERLEAGQRARIANGTAHPAELRATADAKRAEIEAAAIAKGMSPEDARELAAACVARQGGAA